MARIAVNFNEKEEIRQESTQEKTNLEHLVKQFYENDTLSKQYAKRAEPYKNSIKEIMLSENRDKFTFDDFKVSCSKIETATFDEDILLAIVKDLNMPQLIKTKEYVDQNLLEQMIYKREVDASNFVPAQIIKESVRLQVTKKK